MPDKSELGRTLLGIDPGLLRTGWGLIRIQGNALSFVASGIIKPPAVLPLAERLHLLHHELSAVCARYHPHEAAIEETFVTANGASTLKLGQARGAILLTLALAGLPVHEYAATLVKKSVVGTGRADKSQITRMVNILLPGCNPATADAADALAVAITHAHHRTVKQLA